MSREEMIDKILEMSKEIIELLGDSVSEDDIKKLYIQTKIMLEMYRKLKQGEFND